VNDHKTAHNDKAAALRALHVPGDPLVIPNGWDAASARTIVSAGFPAVATTSAGLAPALGFEDGERAPVDEIFAALGRIAGAVEVPVTADIERGYRLAPGEVVERLAEAGVVGCNLEDSRPDSGEMVDAGEQAEFLAAVRAAAVEADVDLVLNARLDIFLRSKGGEASALQDEALRRAELYASAGVDCVYPLGLGDTDVIRALVQGAGVPINLAFRPEVGSFADMAALGVARVSFGPRLFFFLQAQLKRTLDTIHEGGNPF
jgi:2-methylisocitrate lyase-like PEP mutase family enzyme